VSRLHSIAAPGADEIAGRDCERFRRNHWVFVKVGGSIFLRYWTTLLAGPSSQGSRATIAQMIRDHRQSPSTSSLFAPEAELPPRRRSSNRDEVVKGVEGKPLFRLRRQRKAMHCCCCGSSFDEGA